MRIIAIANQKGGCGKTTTAAALGWILGTRGHRTLLVDLDPQAHCTMSLGVNPEGLDLNLADVLSESVFDGGATRLGRVVRTVRENLWLAPAGVELSGLEQRLADVQGREERLSEHLAVMDGAMDEVVVDCPPTLGLLTFNALIAASEAIVPVDCSPLSLRGIGRLKETARLVRQMTGHTVRLRPLVTLYDPRTRNSRETYDVLVSEFGADTILHPIRYTVRLREMVGKGRIRSALASSSTAAKDYEALATQLLDEKRDLAVTEVDREPVPVLRVVPGGLSLSFAGRSPEEALIAGDFNEWIPDRGIKLERDAQGRWRKFIPVEPGTHQYRFVLRGQWVSDPRNPHTIGNEFGSTNSLIHVE